jgi:hypothetical protein
MSVTLENLVDQVNEKLENNAARGTATATGDGTSTTYQVSPIGRRIVDNALFACYVDGVEDATGTMDFSSGVYTFPAATTSGDVLTWVFDYVYWPESLVIQAVNAGVASLFPSFYGVTDAITAMDGSTYEIDVGTTESEFVRQVETSSTGTEPWAAMRRASRFEVQKRGGGLSVRFFTAPQGSVRVWTIDRPVLLGAGDALDIPDRAAVPITSYACYFLLAQKMAPRIRADVAVVTQGVGTLSPRQMNDAANSFYMMFQMQLASTKMAPWAGY